MTRRNCGFRSWMAVAVLVVGSLAMIVAAAPSASAQDDPDNPALPYPGPFDQDETDEADGDEVLGASAQADDAVSDAASDSDDHYDPDAYHPDRSIDYFDDRWEVPNPIASADPATGGGTAGGLAATGSDVEPIVGLSAGLLALGGSVLVSSRRRLRNVF